MSAEPAWWSTWANRVTTVRLVGTATIAVLTALLALAELGGSRATTLLVAIVAIAFICEALDGVDGWLARRLDQATPFGARFDMEVDAAMMMVLSVTLVAAGVAGWWVLLFGGWRYLYVLTALVVPALRRRLPYRYSRKVIAAGVALAVIGSLGLDLLGAPGSVVTAVLVIALGVLSWSFIRDIIWQLRATDQG